MSDELRIIPDEINEKSRDLLYKVISSYLDGSLPVSDFRRGMSKGDVIAKISVTIEDNEGLLIPYESTHEMAERLACGFKESAEIPDDEPRQIVCTGEEAGADVWNPAFGTWEADDFGIESDEPVGHGERLFVNRRLYDAILAENEALKAAQTSSAITELQRLGQEYDAAQVACVKPLVWSDGGSAEAPLRASGYWIDRHQHDYAVLQGSGITRKEFTGEDAKQKAIEFANRHHQRRILSAITMRSETEVWNEAIETMCAKAESEGFLSVEQIRTLKRKAGQ
ncbi:MAG: hypothetical protein EP336_09360 [Rhodobacteraceae bacterium]|nr:MAG: hypothetical protein EP336_09360 [Paracoccaceae bacterium]